MHTIYKVGILQNKNSEIILLLDNLQGTKEKTSELGQAFFDIISSLEPDKYKDAKPVLIPVK